MIILSVGEGGGNGCGEMFTFRSKKCCWSNDVMMMLTMITLTMTMMMNTMIAVMVLLNAQLYDLCY